MVVGSSGNRAVHEAAIAQVVNASGRVKGVAFAVTERHFLTCAHVVNVILGRSLKQPDWPASSVMLRFPFLSRVPSVQAKVVYWKAPSDARDAAEEDIAVLELIKLIPGIQPVTFADYRTGDRQFSAFGYPKDRPSEKGVWAEGKILETVSLGWVQIQGIYEPGRRVERGFSGTPVWDNDRKTVLGMIVAEYDNYEAAKVAYMLPAQILELAVQRFKSLNADPSLVPPNQSPSPLAIVKQKGIQKQLDLVLKQIAALYEKLALDRSGADAVLIQAEIEDLEKKAENLTKQLDDLR